MIYRTFRQYILEEVENTEGVEVIGTSTFFYPSFKGTSYGNIHFNSSIPDFKSIKDKPIEEPDTECTSSGVIIIEPDSRIWLRKVANNFGGYEYSFAKGRMEKGFTEQQNAIKETYEEMGLVVDIERWLTDIEGDTSVTRFYIGSRIGGHPSFVADQDFVETDYVVLTDKRTAMTMLNRGRDKQILRMI
jgi:8-oxo-dGTP pyrophosphatase MutT (NUDIX family)